LDVHRWSEHPEVNTFVDRIYSSLPQFIGNKKIRKQHLKVLLLDLYLAWSVDPDLKLAIHRDNNGYKAKSRYNELHISKMGVTFVEKKMLCTSWFHCAHLPQKLYGSYAKLRGVREMWKVILLVSMLWSANLVMAETPYKDGLDASEVIREGQILAVEREGND
jgi:hypothetical protein